MDDARGGLRGLRARPSQRLLDVIRSRWGIDCGSHPVDLGGSSNLNLLVSDRADRFVVRVYRPYVTAERLRDAHLVRSVLDTAGVPCGDLVPTRDGQSWVVFEGRLVEVERFVERDAQMDSWERLEIRLPVLGRIHTVLRDLEVGEAGTSPMFANHVDSPEALERTLRGTRRIRAWDPSPPELRLATDAEDLARLVTRAERPLADQLPRQLVHGDFWDNNVFFRGGSVVFVTDFDFMGERARIDDLALTLFFTCMEFLEEPVSDDQLGRLRRLIDAYDAGSDDPLTATERAALPPAIARQPLWSIGGCVASLDDKEAARQHAAAMAPGVRWALSLIGEVDRWQAVLA